jgi:hypothetical protein
MICQFYTSFWKTNSLFYLSFAFLAPIPFIPTVSFITSTSIEIRLVYSCFSSSLRCNERFFIWDYSTFFDASTDWYEILSIPTLLFPIDFDILSFHLYLLHKFKKEVSFLPWSIGVEFPCICMSSKVFLFLFTVLFHCS